MKCLIADDDAFSGTLLKNMLPDFFCTDIVENGEDAVSYFRTAIESGQPYDMICMDVEMPKCDGSEALAKIRLIEKNLDLPANKCAKVIMITSHNEPGTIIEAYSKGAASYIVKPISNKILMQILKRFKFIE